MPAMPLHPTYSDTTLAENTNRRNILIVGDVGVGKSSLVNLIAGKEIAVTSSSAKSCTLQSQEYDILLDGIELALYDTAGLHEAHANMKKAEYLDAVIQAYSLIARLEKSGGINLIVFCMKGGRISNITQQTYSLFVEAFCNSQVPVVIAVTHLEMHDPMESWWRENEQDIRDYGFESRAHACITATRGLKDVFSEQYEESRDIIRKLIVQHSGEATHKEEKTSWVKRVVSYMRARLVAPSRLAHSDLKKKLIKRCGLSSEEARFVAQSMAQV